MILVRVLLGGAWGLVLSGGGFGALWLVGNSLHLLTVWERGGTEEATSWPQLVQALSACLAWAVALWLGLWFTSPLVHAHRRPARLAMLVAATPGVVAGAVVALFLAVMSKGVA